MSRKILLLILGTLIPLCLLCGCDVEVGEADGTGGFSEHMTEPDGEGDEIVEEDFSGLDIVTDASENFWEEVVTVPNWAGDGQGNDVE